MKKYTDGGWLTISSTEAYNTFHEQTTLYIHNDQYRVSLEIKPNGSYRRYEYDDQGRVVLEATPWAGGGSLVGTRPPTLDEYESYTPEQKRRLSFRPGITGLWQVSGRSEITDFDEVVKLDVAYMDGWTIWRDIRILLKTIKVVVMKDGAK